MPGTDSHQFADAVRRVVLAIPRGTLASYGQVAARAGHPGAARAVGAALTGGIPWWRVVHADGSLARGEEQARRLRVEGVAVAGGRVTEALMRAALRGGAFDAP